MTVEGQTRYEGSEAIACVDTEVGEEIVVEKIPPHGDIN